MAIVSLSALQESVRACKSFSPTFDDLVACKEKAAGELEVMTALEGRWSVQENCDVGNIELLGLAEMGDYMGFDLNDIKDIESVRGCNVQRLSLSDGRVFFLKRAGHSGDVIDDLEINYQVQTIADLLNEDVPRVVWTDMQEGVVAFTNIPSTGNKRSHWTLFQPHELVTSLVFETLVGDHDRNPGNAYEVYDAVYGHIDFSGAFSLQQPIESEFSPPVRTFLGDLRTKGIDQMESEKPGIKASLQQALRDWRWQSVRLAAIGLKDFPVTKLAKVTGYLQEVAKGKVPDFTVDIQRSKANPQQDALRDIHCDERLDQLEDLLSGLGDLDEEGAPAQPRWAGCHPFGDEFAALARIDKDRSLCKFGPDIDAVGDRLLIAQNFCLTAYDSEMPKCNDTRIDLDVIDDLDLKLQPCASLPEFIARLQAIDTSSCPVQSARKDRIEDELLTALGLCG